MLKYVEAMRPLAGRVKLPAFLLSYEGMLGLGVLALFLYFIFASDTFRSISNLQGLTLPITYLGLVCIGVAFALICGVIDLSVGSIMAATIVMTGGLIEHVGVPVPLAIIMVIIFGMLLGLLNGLLVTGLRLPSFIVTLGTLAAYRAMAERMQWDFFGRFHSEPIHSDMLSWFGGGSVVGGLTVSFFIFVGIALFAHYVLAHSKLGVMFFAVGGNERAAYAAGTSPNQIRVLAFVISGACAALAGVILGARYQASVPTAGVGFEFEALTAVIIGGASLFGGSGSIIGTMFGVILLRVLINGLTHLDVVIYDQMFIRAAIFIGLLWVDATFRRGRRGQVATV